MRFSKQDIQAILRDGFGIEGKLRELPGEHDINRHALRSDGEEFLLKILAPTAEPESLDMQVKVREHLALNSLEFPRYLAGSICSSVDRLLFIVRLLLQGRTPMAFGGTP